MSETTPRIHAARRILHAAATLLLAAPAMVNAYSVNSYQDGDETLYLKWGDNHAGTLGGTVYWSFIPAGTSGSVYCSDACPGTSGSSINIEISPGGGFTLQPVTDLESHITGMMALWSAATGIQFVKLDSDSGVAINDAAAVPPATGQIRIGVFAFNPGVSEAAVGYSPPPNGGTGSGDILFNSNDYYQFAPGSQGDPYDPTYAPNDIDGLILHELGHAIGLEHPVHVAGQCPIMDVDAACFGYVNRELGADDKAGAMFLYDTLFASGFE